MKKFLLMFIVFMLIFTCLNLNIVFSEPQYKWRLEDFDIPEDAYDNMLLLINSANLTPSHILTFENTNVKVSNKDHYGHIISDYHKFSVELEGVSNRVKFYRIEEDSTLVLDVDKDLAVSSSGFFNTMIAECNFPLYSEDGSLELHPGMFRNYYIEDFAMIFDNDSIDDLLEMEKKWEKNLNCQFFIYTYKDDIDEIRLMKQRGNSRTSGNGSLYIFVQHRYDGTFRIGLGISKRFGHELPYQPYSQMFNLVAVMQKSIEGAYDFHDSSCLVCFLNVLYQDILYLPDEEMDGVCDENSYLDSHYKTFYKWLRTDRPLYDDSISSYNLLSGRLEYECPCEDNINYIGPAWTNDEYYWQLPGDSDFNHVYFYDVDGFWFNDDYPIEPTYTPSPLPTFTPQPTPPLGTYPPVSFSPLPTSVPAGGISDPGVLGFLLKLFTLLIRIIGSILGFLLSALAYIFSLRDVSSVNHLLTEEMVLGLEWLKQIEVPIFGITIWSFLVLIFESCLIFVVFKLIRRIIHTAAGSGD